MRHANSTTTRKKSHWTTEIVRTKVFTSTIRLLRAWRLRCAQGRRTKFSSSLIQRCLQNDGQCLFCGWGKCLNAVKRKWRHGEERDVNDTWAKRNESVFCCDYKRYEGGTWATANIPPKYGFSNGAWGKRRALAYRKRMPGLAKGKFSEAVYIPLRAFFS